jgi:CheY-like chemotaxis protein
MLGSHTALGHWLKVSPDSVRKWASGEETPPSDIHSRVAKLIRSREKAKLENSQLSSTDSTPSNRGAGMRVLVADDERDKLMTVGILLRSEGFEVRLVQGGAEVLPVVQSFGPHAVLLDLDMPDPDGNAVAADLRKHYGEVGPVLIAGVPRKNGLNPSAAQVRGFHHHISKPYDLEELLNLLIAIGATKGLTGNAS